MVNSGTLYGVGVGPGDPELLTVKAWRLLSTTPVIAYLSANGGESMARDIAKPFLPEDVIEIAIDVPMRPERAPAEKAYDDGCNLIASHLVLGRNVVVLCEGDPFFYGSFMYIYSRLAPKHPALVVPGVASVTASAAAIGRPLAARNEVFKVVPATLEPQRLRDELRATEFAAIIKVGRHFAKVRTALLELDLLSSAIAVIRASASNEEVIAVKDVKTDALPYFSTILVYAGREAW